MFNLAVGWILMYALYVVFMRGNSSPDPTRRAKFEFRNQVAGRFGLLPPSSELIGIGLWALTIAGFLVSLGLFLVDARFVGAASATMLGSFLLTLWRDDQWIKRQPGYQAAIEALAASDAASSDEESEG